MFALEDFSLKVGGVWCGAPRLLFVLTNWTVNLSTGSSPSSNCSTSGKGTLMQKKSCSECGEPAEMSLCQIISTVGIAPRQQRCTTSTAFCAAGLQGRIKLLCREGLHGIHKPLSETYTAMANDCAMRLTRAKPSKPTTESDGGR